MTRGPGPPSAFPGRGVVNLGREQDGELSRGGTVVGVAIEEGLQTGLRPGGTVGVLVVTRRGHADRQVIGILRERGVESRFGPVAVADDFATLRLEQLGASDPDAGEDVRDGRRGGLGASMLDLEPDQRQPGPRVVGPALGHRAEDHLGVVGTADVVQKTGPPGLRLGGLFRPR